MPRDRSIHTVIGLGLELGAELELGIYFDLQSPTIRCRQHCSLDAAEPIVWTQKYIYLAILKSCRAKQVKRQ